MSIRGWKAPRGLTLAEALVAFALMSVLIVVIIGVFTKLLLSSTKSANQTAAQLLAKSVLERAVREGPNDWGVGFTANPGATLYTQDRATGTEFIYQVVPAQLTTPPPSPAPSMGILYDVTVIVSWWEDSADAQGGRRDMGKLSTQISRTVFVRQ